MIAVRKPWPATPAPLPVPPPQLRPLPLGLLYYPGVRCPGCGGRHFAVGRITAECATCTAALILSNPSDEEHDNG